MNLMSICLICFIFFLFSIYYKQLPDCLYRLMDGKKSITDNVSKKREKNHDDKNGRKNNDVTNDTINDDKLKDKTKAKIRRVSYSDIADEEINGLKVKNDTINIKSNSIFDNDKQDKGIQNRKGNKR